MALGDALTKSGRGEVVHPPEEQEVVQIALEKAGVTQPMEFDEYIEAINWIPWVFFIYNAQFIMKIKGKLNISFKGSFSYEILQYQWNETPVPADMY